MKSRTWKGSISAALGAMICVAVALDAPAALAAEVLKFGHVYPTSRRDHECTLSAAAKIAQLSDGRFEVQIFPNSELGSEEQLHQQLTLGSVNIAIIAGPFASSLYPPLGVDVVPFAFRDFEHWKIYAKSDLFQELKEGYESTSGNKIVSTHLQGTSHLLSNDPITKPEDMRGLKMRVPNAPPWLVFPLAVGAQPAPIAYSEVYLALQQGVVDIMDQVPAGIKSMRFAEVRDTVNLTAHVLLPAHTIVGAPLWNRLSDDDRSMFTNVFAETAAECSELINDDEQTILNEFEQSGIEIVEIDRAAFEQALDEYIEKTEFGWSRDHLNQLKAMR